MEKLAGTEIRILNPNIERGKIRFAIFDFDGTVSLLREGWQNIMAPMMVEMICGDHDPSEPICQEVERRVRDYIDESTGIQTILQMEKLVEMVREFGLVPEDKVLDAWGYKQIYNDRLMQPVRERLSQLERGEKTVEDFTVRGAIDTLRALRERGVTLYAASGTDRDDVVNEAKALGVDSYFDGGIFGALRSYQEYNKEKVIRQILNEHNLSGPELVIFGDGPVEIRLARQYGAIGVGVASDEKRGEGWNDEKVARLTKAGADILIPDFKERKALLDYLFAES
ncbi:MAG: HAD hydrolase-like protein [Calditrichaeota bacterium]|nr:HAD hydrolase-like protein [Calditrichota bacterium]